MLLISYLFWRGEEEREGRPPILVFFIGSNTFLSSFFGDECAPPAFAHRPPSPSQRPRCLDKCRVLLYGTFGGEGHLSLVCPPHRCVTPRDGSRSGLRLVFFLRCIKSRRGRGDLLNPFEYSQHRRAGPISPRLNRGFCWHKYPHIFLRHNVSFFIRRWVGDKHQR